MTARFEVVRTNAAQPWHARFRAANGEIVWTTETYVDRDAALEAIYQLARPIGIAGRWPLAVDTTTRGQVTVRLVDERVRTAQMRAWDRETERGVWTTVELPGGCTGWNGVHSCGREDGHAGDHVCHGCHDQWNREEWESDPEQAAWVAEERPDEADRCQPDDDEKEAGRG